MLRVFFAIVAVLLALTVAHGQDFSQGVQKQPPFFISSEERMMLKPAFEIWLLLDMHAGMFNPDTFPINISTAAYQQATPYQVMLNTYCGVEQALWLTTPCLGLGDLKAKTTKVTFGFVKMDVLAQQRAFDALKKNASMLGLFPRTSVQKVLVFDNPTNIGEIPDPQQPSPLERKIDEEKADPIAIVILVLILLCIMLIPVVLIKCKCCAPPPEYKHQNPAGDTPATLRRPNPRAEDYTVEMEEAGPVAPPAPGTNSQRPTEEHERL